MKLVREFEKHAMRQVYFGGSLVMWVPFGKVNHRNVIVDIID